MRVYGDASLPTLIYLPGMHGDWTLISGFRAAVAGKVRFVEMTYPRTLTWSLDDHAAAIEEALSQKRHHQRLAPRRILRLSTHVGHARSWKIKAKGAILAGGFVRHTGHRFMRLIEKIAGRISWALFVKIVFGYAKFARFRYRRSPETVASLDEFIARRSPLDKQAAQYRLHLIARNDPGLAAKKTKVPIYAVSGFWDPLVPWPMVRRWLKRIVPPFASSKSLAAPTTTS